MTIREAVISSDIDTLESIYHGQGCLRKAGYTYAEFQIGLENFAHFLDRYHANATLFMVGQDFCRVENHAAIRAMVQRGDELANHTHTHAQGLRLLSPQAKEDEIAQMEAACLEFTGVKPIGFRSPGWNISDDVMAILLRRGYLYDSSVFPTALTPLLKFLHWRTMSGRSAIDRSTLGQLDYMTAPLAPYRTRAHKFGRRGTDGLLEFPITVTPILRLPFFATFLLSTGFRLFETSYHMLKASGRLIQFQFHLSDFVDYQSPLLADQTPRLGHGQYVPKALYTGLKDKLLLFERAIDLIAQDYAFVTFKTLAQRQM